MSTKKVGGVAMILPMNAKSCGDKLEKLMDDPRYVAEIKLDGYRAIFEDGGFHSRLGNDLSAKVPHLVSVLAGYDVVLDGELCMSSPTSNSSDVTKILGALPEKAVARQEELGKLRYVVFDVLTVDGKDLIGKPWEYRRDFLESFFELHELNEYIKISAIYYDKRRLLANAELNGLEGIMLKNIDSLYYPDKRPEGCWYKVKKSMTYDVVVMGFTAGKGKYEGLIGAVEFGLYKDGALTYCGQCSGFTDDMRRILTEFPENYLGQVMEISAMERTKDGMFRHPVYKGFRDDKEAQQCQWIQC